MVTDTPPRTAAPRRRFEASDARTKIPMPPARDLQDLSEAVRAALESEDPRAVKKTGTALLSFLSGFYRVSEPTLVVLGSRPLQVVEGHHSWELFGDYTPRTQKIRVWMRTAVLGKVTSHKGLLNTLLHEFCHHLDIVALGFETTPHTRGFYHRVDDLYHLALATPPEKRRPLHWIKRGAVWRIDWRKTRTSP